MKKLIQAVTHHLWAKVMLSLLPIVLLVFGLIIYTSIQAQTRILAQQAESSASLRASLEREYQLFTEVVNQWKVLQAERYERKKAELGGAIGVKRELLGDALEEKKQRLQQKWEHLALRTKLKELEYGLKMQRKRLGLLMQQVQLQAQAA